MILIIKNDKPFALRKTIEEARKLRDDIKGWNLWQFWDMSTIPPSKVENR
jgi:hypothetical protein